MRIQRGQGHAAYLKAPGVNGTFLKQFLRSPAHGQSSMEGRYRIDSVALSKGTALHVCMEGEEEFRNAYTVAPKIDRRTKEGKAEFAAFQEAHAGKTVLTPEEWADIQGMREGLMRVPAIRQWVESFSIEREVSVYWTHEETGLPCKARCDLWEISEGVVLDYKSCQDASSEGFSRAIKHFGYDLSAVHYMEGTRCQRYGWLAVESKPPYVACLHWLMPGPRFEWLRQRREEMLIQIKELSEKSKREENFRWPGYGDNGECIIQV